MSFGGSSGESEHGQFSENYPGEHRKRWRKGQLLKRRSPGEPPSPMFSIHNMRTALYDSQMRDLYGPPEDEISVQESSIRGSGKATRFLRRIAKVVNIV